MSLNYSALEHQTNKFQQGNIDPVDSISPLAALYGNYARNLEIYTEICIGCVVCFRYLSGLRVHTHVVTTTAY